jgi:predicted MPP superfamily phosphohydrolase
MVSPDAMTVDKHTDLDTVGEVLLEMDARDRGCPSQGPTPWIGMENLIREKSVQRHVMGDEHESKMFQGKRILAFIVAFETFSLLIHYYVFSHLFYLFDVKTDGWFWIFIIVLSVLWLLAMGFGMWHASPATNVFHVVSSLWLGLLFMFMFTLIGWDVVRQFVSPDRELVAATVVAIALGAMIYGLMNARFLRIKEHVLSTDKIEGEVRIAHLSDIHIGSVYGPSYLRKVVDRTNSLDPDMVLITGDLADGAFDYNDDTFRALDGLKAPTYYVTGNHEHYAGLTQVLGSLSATKVHHLVNDMVIEKGIQLIGVDYWADKNEVARTIDEIAPDGARFTIVMYHVPRELDAVRERNVDLMLSGHTHGGQYFPFTLFARLVWKKHKGLYDLGSARLFVSSGIGTWGPPIRIGTSSQVGLLRIRGKGPATGS